MTGSVMVLVLTLASVEGDVAQLREGLLDGLRSGDTGTVFYELSVGGARREIDVGTATVIESNEVGATLRVPAGTARAGHLVRFELPLERAEPATLIRVARDRLTEERFEELLSRFLDRLIPADAAVERVVVERLAERADRRARDAEELAREAAETAGALARAAEATAKPVTPRAPEPEEAAAAPRPSPSDVPAPAPMQATAAEPVPAAPAGPAVTERPVGGSSAGDAEPSRRIEVPTRKTPVSPPQPIAPPAAAVPPPGAARLRVPGGAYEIGLDLAEAEYYSQHPRFRIELAAFAIDERPVSRAEFLSYQPTAVLPGVGADEIATNVTYDEAAGYCAARGGHLPTELEWEVTMELGKAEAGLLEWTASWYQPYPGNQIAEEEYGETHRVLRGSPHPGRQDLHRRRYAVPSARHPKLGFRCAGA